MSDRGFAFAMCLIYDVIVMAMVFYLISFQGWSKWTYLLCVLNGAGLTQFFYKSFGKAINKSK